MKKILGNQEQMVDEIKNQQVTQKLLEQQLRQLQLVLNTSPQSGFPSDNEPPKKVMKITLRSGKELNKRPLQTNKEVYAKLVPQLVAKKVAENL